MGKILAGRYEVIRELGRGSTGSVYLCTDRSENRHIALKEISRPYIETVRREFEILRAIDHPGVAKAFDYIEEPSSGMEFLAQEYIEGADLFEASRGADPKKIARWGLEIALTLNFLHRRGIIHGDLKPQNIIIPPKDSALPVLLDFGLSGGGDSDDSIRGTPAYISPELLHGAIQSPLTDIYSLGAVLYHCLAGEPPYPGDTMADVLHSIAHGSAKPLREKRPDVSTELARIVENMICRDPTFRYQSAGRVAVDLGKYLGEAVSLEKWRGGRWPMLGRDEELARLKRLIDSLESDKSPKTVLIHGPKGMGSSRLLEAAVDYARTGGIPVFFVPLASGKDPAKKLIEILPSVNIKSEPRPAENIAILAAEEKASLLTRRLIAEALSRASAERPILVAFDDLEEGTDSAVELVRFLALEFSKTSGKSAPLIIMATFSGAVPAVLIEDITIGWIENIELGALPNKFLAAAIEESWGTAPSEKAVTKLAELSGGNPLWLREILQMVIGEDKIERAKAPESLGALMRVTAAALSPEFIRLLEAMAVFGEPASINEIVSLGSSSAGDVAGALGELVRRGLVKAEGGLFSPATPLLAALITSDAAPSVIRRLHFKSAEILKARSNAPPEFIAKHLLGAGQAETALPYVLSGGSELRARGSHREAALLYESILKESPADINSRKELLEGLARSAAPAGLWREALSSLRERLEIEPSDSPSIRAGFHLEMAHCQQRIGEYDRAERAVERAMSELKGDSHSETALQAAEISALLNIARGRYEDAMAVCVNAMQQVGADSEAVAPFRAVRGIALVYLGRYKEAIEELKAVIDVFRANGDGVRLIMALSGMGIAYQHIEEDRQAVLAYQDALEIARKEGDLRAEATILMNIATLHQGGQRWAEAKLHYSRALVVARQVGGTADEVRILGNLGNLLIYLGDMEGALPLVEQSLRGSKRLGLNIYQAYAHLLRGDILKSRGEMIAAAREYARSRRLFDKSGSAREAIQAELRRGRLYLEMGEKSRARQSISKAMREADLLNHNAFHAEAALLEARWDIVSARTEDAETEARKAVELLKNYGESFRWEAGAILGAALLKAGKKDEAKIELEAAYQTAITLRDSIPAEYRDSFLSGPVWDELSRNLESVMKKEGLVPEERWKKLLEISRRLSTEHDLGQLLELIMDSVLELIEAERGFLILIEDGKMTIPTARNLDRESIRGAKMKISRSIAEEVTRSGMPLITVDAQHDSRLDQFASVRDLKLRSVLCIPLKIRDRIIGTLYVDNRFREGAFREEDLTLMEAFATQAAIAIDNARSNAELEKSNRRIKELAEQLERRVNVQSAQIDQMRVELARHATPESAATYPEIVTASAAMREVFGVMDRVTMSDAPVLIEGESGTGKELVARAIHFHGSRKNDNFLSENCSAIPESLLESALFGHEKGAFTGATERKIGLFEMADGGTLFLDEIGDMSPGMQAKLLRVLQEGDVRRVGGEKSFRVNVRVISATHQMLEELVRKGRFREDLYWRLNVIKISIPPLRERREDIPLLADYFCKRFSEEMSRRIEVNRAAMQILVSYDWPGNVRELENEIRKAAVLGDGVIQPESLSGRILDSVQGRKYSPFTLQPLGTLKTAVEQFEKEYLLQVLEECHGNRAEAARRLRIGRRTLYDKLARFGIAEEEK